MHGLARQRSCSDQWMMPSALSESQINQVVVTNATESMVKVAVATHGLIWNGKSDRMATTGDTNVINVSHPWLRRLDKNRRPNKHGSSDARNARMLIKNANARNQSLFHGLLILFNIAERHSPGTRYWGHPFGSDLGFSSSSDFESGAVAGWLAPSCSVFFFL